MDFLESVRRDGRTLLTRNTLLVKRNIVREIEYLMVCHDHFRDQLVQVIRHFRLTAEGSGKRCARCNITLEKTSRDSVARIVPYYVAAKHLNFSRCPSCCRVYWPATHSRSMKGEIHRLLERARSETPAEIE